MASGIPEEELKEAHLHLEEARFDPSEFSFELTERGLLVLRSSGQRRHYDTQAHFWVNEFGLELRSGFFGQA